MDFHLSLDCRCQMTRKEETDDHPDGALSRVRREANRPVEGRVAAATTKPAGAPHIGESGRHDRTRERKEGQASDELPAAVRGFDDVFVGAEPW
jgi:hypothetical protein